MLYIKHLTQVFIARNGDQYLNKTLILKETNFHGNLIFKILLEILSQDSRIQPYGQKDMDCGLVRLLQFSQLTPDGYILLRTLCLFIMSSQDFKVNSQSILAPMLKI